MFGEGKNGFLNINIVRCLDCKMIYEYFIKVGCFGCVFCYDIFKGYLNLLLKWFYGGYIEYCGKILEWMEGNIYLKKELDELKFILK